jgi:transketolase
MRTAFFNELLELAETDPKIMVVTGDLGFGVVDGFVGRFPDRFVNVGVAEQNMTGVAAGMALTGKTVFTYSIGNFPTLRCLEQVRNDIAYHRANVKVVTVGGGFAYGGLGMSHHATEDIAIMRALPEMVVLVPGDPFETASLTRAAAALDGPCYLRLGRAGEPNVHSGPVDVEIGKAMVVREGSDVSLIASGAMLRVAMEGAELLAKEGLEARVLSMHTIKPLDVDAVAAAAAETKGIVTIEEHNVLGGLGGAVAEAVAEGGPYPSFFRRIGVPDAYAPVVGDQSFLWEHFGLTAAEVARAVREGLRA